MKKILVLLLMLALSGFVAVDAADKAAKKQAKLQKEALKAQEIAKNLFENIDG